MCRWWSGYGDDRGASQLTIPMAAGRRSCSCARVGWSTGRDHPVAGWSAPSSLVSSDVVVSTEWCIVLERGCPTFRPGITMIDISGLVIPRSDVDRAICSNSYVITSCPVVPTKDRDEKQEELIDRAVAHLLGHVLDHGGTRIGAIGSCGAMRSRSRQR